jgi:hypothetical protein
VLEAVLTGKLRRQFYSDVFHFSDAPDAPRQVASGYICLAGSAGWLLGLINTIILNPTQVETLVLAGLNAAACITGFLRLRLKRDPRQAIDWLIWASLATAMFVAYRNAGVIVRSPSPSRCSPASRRCTSARRCAPSPSCWAQARLS